MLQKISELKTKIESHLNLLEKDEKYKFFKEKDEILLSTRLFLRDDLEKSLQSVGQDNLPQRYAAYIEIENNLQGLINA